MWILLCAAVLLPYYHIQATVLCPSKSPQWPWEEDLVLEAAWLWDLQCLFFWALLAQPMPQLLLSSQLVGSPRTDSSGLPLIHFLPQNPGRKGFLLPSSVSSTHNLDLEVLHFMNIKARVVGFHPELIIAQ